MTTKQTPKRQKTLTSQNEWLSVAESLDSFMASQAAQKMTRMEKPLIDTNTLSAVNTAYSVTLRYYTALLGGINHSPEAQKAISQLWQKAGTRLRRYDSSLANHLKAENKFWSKDVTWAKETIQKTWAHLNSIRTSSNMIDPEVGSLVRRFSTS